MTTPTEACPAIVRTERGLTLAGTRTTLYDVMDYLAADWPPTLIRDRLDLTDQQIDAALDYIDRHRVEVEAEYQEVLRSAEEMRRYWDERNRERLAAIAQLPPKPGQEVIRAKLKAWKARLEFRE